MISGTSLDLLTAAGLLVLPDFVDEWLCADLRSAVIQGASQKATIARGAIDQVVDERTRRTRGALVPPSLCEAVDRRLGDVRPLMAEHFGVALGTHEAPQYLAYSKGDFFRPHQDNSSDPAVAGFIRERAVSVVVFLGRQARLPELDTYCGGELIFFRLPGLSGPDGVRATIWGSPGLLIAFPSDQLHEVAPVTHGFRGSIVTWFAADRG